MSGAGLRAAHWRLVGVPVVLVMLEGCSSSGTGLEALLAGARSRVAPATAVAPPPPSTTSAPTTTEEPGPPPTAAPAPEPPPPTVDPGRPEVRELQQRLAGLGYDVGTVDGAFGGRTRYAVTAFQKVEGLRRTGADGPELRAALETAFRPGPMVPGGAPNRIEIDLTRQVLFHWQGGALARILPVSSGNGEAYCVEGECDVAVTPPGSFRIGRKAVGLEVAPLGELWWPMYFNGGIAIHGSLSVPAFPASHGCIRIPMYAAPGLYDQVAPGTPVLVVGRGPGPEGARAVPPPEPPPATTTTTTTTPLPEDTTTTSTSTSTTTTVPPTTTTTSAVDVTIPRPRSTTTTTPATIVP